MLPLLKPNDDVLAKPYKKIKQLQVGDIVVAKHPHSNTSVLKKHGASGILIIKQCKEIRAREFQRNTGPLAREFQRNTGPLAREFQRNTGPSAREFQRKADQIDAKTIFLEGLNSKESSDSHDWGCVPSESILAIVTSKLTQ